MVPHNRQVRHPANPTCSSPTLSTFFKEIAEIYANNEIYGAGKLGKKFPSLPQPSRKLPHHDKHHEVQSQACHNYAWLFACQAERIRSDLVELRQHKVASPGHVVECQVFEDQVERPVELGQETQEQRVVEHAFA